ncbi:F-box only protein 15 isoform X4 [Neopelma chrysocephalum]|uniref:F-box only protein 15 isoform X4 n=1 Tax=Neopelma chrysocephalum TaxID=114329 RepID=UPI000FCD4950|nr:F-box only protein 15 isoform X4 [Neopelma chrysocephalum]
MATDRGRNRVRTFAARPGECSEAVNAGIKSLYLTPAVKWKPRVCIESMPSEMLLKIFSYLDAVSLLSVGCVNKLFYDLANDKLSGLSWIIVLKDKNGKEHVMEKANLSFKHTSVTILWYSTNWPCLDIVSTLKLFGVMPLFLDQSIPPNKKGPRRLSLIAEYHLANLTESSAAVGADGLVQLFSLNPGLLIGIWKEKNEIAFVMVSLHYHQLLERSILGSATVQYAPPPNKPVLDDIDPEYGLHDYRLHLEMHGRSCTYLRGTFRNVFCRKGDIANGYLRLTVVSLKDNRKHLPLIGTLGLSWETDVFKGNVKDCYMMNLTLFDEIGEPFWCFSAPVCMELSSKTSGLYDYMGHIYTTNYADSEGKVCVKLVWLEETRQYIIVSLVLYVSTEKVNKWYGTNY